MNNKNENKSSYVKCYLNLCCMFDPCEIVFLLHLVNINCLRNGGYNTVWSKTYLMQRMNLGLRVFNRCIKRMTELGLLERRLQNGMYDYHLNMAMYERMLEILTATSDTSRLSCFCKQTFLKEKRRIADISDMEIKKLGEK